MLSVCTVGGVRGVNPAGANRGQGAEVIIGRQRQGPIGTAKVTYERWFGQFSNLAPAYQAEGGEVGSAVQWTFQRSVVCDILW